MKSPATKIFWSRADTLRLARMVLLGLAVGIIGRWIYLSTPPQAVLAASPGDATTITAPAKIKSEGVSPSGRD